MSCRALCALVVCGVLVPALDASAVSVTFQVRMQQAIASGIFDPADDFVDVAGTFNGWGTSHLTVLSDADGDSIYDVTVDGFAAGETFEYKFRIDGVWDGREEFPGGGPNRSYTVQSSGNEILVWYSDIVPDRGVAELEWWNDTVFYEIFVRSFQDSDGDGIGDFQGLIQRLDHLNDGDPNTTDDLGVTGIWLMPINTSPSYHGYDVVDYRGIEPDYGTMADFQEFLAEAHARGIRVIVDYVMNHASSQHPWFLAAGSGDPFFRDWFVWSPTDPGQTGPWGQDVWHRYGSSWYYGLFWGGMPDLNYDTPAVRTSMFDTATWWLDTVGVDGFRLDAVLYIDETGDQLQSTPQTLDFWRDFNLHVKSVDPQALSVGEAWTNSATVNQYVIEDRLDLAFEFDLSNAILGAVNSGDAQFLAYKAAQVAELYPYNQYATFLTNHDQDRVLNVLGEDVDRQKVAAGIYLTLGGVPFLYYGEEVGLLGTKPDPEIRRPMQWDGTPSAGFTTGTPWNEVGPRADEFNVADATQDSRSLLSWYRDLIALRNTTPALRRGDHVPLWSSQTAVFAFLRSYEGQTVMVTVNTAATPVTGVTLAAAASGLATGEHVLEDLLRGGTRTITVTPELEIPDLDLGAHEVAVYAFPLATDVEPDEAVDTGLRLRPTAPNPFTGSTSIRYVLPESTHVDLRIYDVAGRQVAVVHDGVQAAGEHALAWSARDDQRRPLGAGVYFVRLRAAGQERVGKLVFVE